MSSQLLASRDTNTNKSPIKSDTFSSDQQSWSQVIVMPAPLNMKRSQRESRQQGRDTVQHGDEMLALSTLPVQLQQPFIIRLPDLVSPASAYQPTTQNKLYGRHRGRSLPGLAHLQSQTHCEKTLRIHMRNSVSFTRPDFYSSAGIQTLQLNLMRMVPLT